MISRFIGFMSSKLLGILVVSCFVVAGGGGSLGWIQ